MTRNISLINTLKINISKQSKKNPGFARDLKVGGVSQSAFSGTDAVSRIRR
jgi:hypothetical protein